MNLGTVSIGSIIGMVISMLVAIGGPIIVLAWWHKRTGAKLLSALIGAVTFILFALVLERMLHLLVLGNTGDKLSGNLWLYAAYGGAAAGIFEETGRFLAMKICMKKNLDKQNAIMYGIGHGGIEAILLVGVTMQSNIVTSIMINAGQFEKTLQMLDEATRSATLTQVSVLWTTQPFLFYMSGVERVSAFVLHLSLSYLVYRAVRYRKAGWYVLAVFLHFLVDAGTLLLKDAVTIPILEVILMATVAAVAFLVYRIYHKEIYNKEETT